MWPNIRAYVEQDLDQILLLRTWYSEHFAATKLREPSHESVVVMASALHSLYNGAEDALNRILKFTDAWTPTGDSSHADLLYRALEEQAHRPAILSPELGDLLRPLRLFRHFFRHAYTPNFEWEKLAPNAESFEAIVDGLVRELSAFLDWMEESGYIEWGFSV